MGAFSVLVQACKHAVSDLDRAIVQAIKPPKNAPYCRDIKPASLFQFDALTVVLFFLLSQEAIEVIFNLCNGLYFFANISLYNSLTCKIVIFHMEEGAYANSSGAIESVSNIS